MSSGHVLGQNSSGPRWPTWRNRRPPEIHSRSLDPEFVERPASMTTRSRSLERVGAALLAACRSWVRTRTGLGGASVPVLHCTRMNPSGLLESEGVRKGCTRKKMLTGRKWQNRQSGVELGDALLFSNHLIFTATASLPIKSWLVQ